MVTLLLRVVNISIHALREEGDGTRHSGSTLLSIFLSTPSARRATQMGHILAAMMPTFLSTPSARRATALEA